MKFKAISLLAIFLCVLSFCGCGDEKDEGDESTDETLASVNPNIPASLSGYIVGLSDKSGANSSVAVIHTSETGARVENAQDETGMKPSYLYKPMYGNVASYYLQYSRQSSILVYELSLVFDQNDFSKGTFSGTLTIILKTGKTTKEILGDFTLTQAPEDENSEEEQTEDEQEAYEKLKEQERAAIAGFIAGNNIVGQINVISEAKFEAQDSTTNTEKNEFVLFEDEGIYMQIVSKGGGKNIADLAREMPDSTVSKVILCRFMEYDIQNSDTTRLNLYTPSIVDKMFCTYSLFSRDYTASFTEGYMLQACPAVPAGWLKPLNYINLTRDPGNVAKVRVIVPHTAGTEIAAQYVQPYYYEISYQLGK